VTAQIRLQQVQACLQRAEAFAARHPRALTASVVGMLSCFAVTAFGIAPNAPDAAALPKRTIVETLATPSIESQLDELASHAIGLTRRTACCAAPAPSTPPPPPSCAPTRWPAASSRGAPARWST
jgi:hypothetical protein